MEFISVEKLIKILKEKNINLGKGDPYNRFRYYTKIGWLPHMTRKKDENGIIVGHYPESVIEKIIQIEELKKSGKNNDEIQLLIQEKTAKNNSLSIVISYFKKININSVLIFMIVAGFLFESFRYKFLDEKININKNQQEIKTIPAKGIQETGISFLPQGQKIIFVATSRASATSIIMLNFFNNIGYGNNYFVKEIKEGQGFFVETIFPVTEESKFNWLIIQ